MSEVRKKEMEVGKIHCPYFKIIPVYILIFIGISLTLIGLRAAFPDSMVIYAQKEKPDFMQVYFLIDGAYSESNSLRSLKLASETN
jgi:hypothetical protein